MVDTVEEASNIKEMVIPMKLKQGTVLVAEDSKTAQRHIIQIFQKSNIDMKLFENGKLLMKYINSLPDPTVIPAIITDIEMPEMSGFTVIQEIRKNSIMSKVPIIVNSSMTGENNKREAESLGANGFIDKTKSHNVIPLIIEAMEKM
jgi:two-component system chemotaxis response regulator CheV